MSPPGRDRPFRECQRTSETATVLMEIVADGTREFLQRFGRTGAHGRTWAACAVIELSGFGGRRVDRVARQGITETGGPPHEGNWGEPGALVRSAWCCFDPQATIQVSQDAAIACILRLSILTLQRPGDVAAMKTEWVNLESGKWLIMRGLGNHVMPLTPAARSLVRLALSRRRPSVGAAIFQRPP